MLSPGTRKGRRSPRRPDLHQLVLVLDSADCTSDAMAAQPWAVRAVARRYRLPPQIAAVVADLAGIGRVR